MDAEQDSERAAREGCTVKITLFHPFVGGVLQRHRFGLGHLGLAYIGACLLKEGHTVRVLDAKNEAITDEDLRRHIEEFQPDIFGVTAMTHEVHAAAHACTVVKGTNGGCLTVIGGPHSSARPEQTLVEFPSIDVAVAGEGEITMCELAMLSTKDRKTAAFERILGITFQTRDSVQGNANRPWIENLDVLPFPAWHLFPHVDWPVVAGRGCPFGCAFCQRVLGRRVRLRSVDNVIAELDALANDLGRHSSAWFQDDTFGVNPRWLNEFLDKMSARKARRGGNYQWGGNSRVNLADVALYKRMREAGCTDLSFGVESGNDQILRRIHKGTTRAMSVRAIRAARKCGIKTHAFFIIGHPGETLRTALQTVHLAAKCRSDSIAVGVMVPYPGTEIWSMAKNGQYGYRLLSEDWRMYDKYFGNALALQGLSHRMLEFLQALTYAWYYAYNLRVRDLFKFLVRYRLEAWFLLRRVRHLGKLQAS